MVLKLIIRCGVWIVLMAAVLFASAGRWTWPEGWAFIAIFTLESIAFCAWLFKRDPALLESRLNVMPRAGQPAWDRVFVIVIILFWCAWLALMAADGGRWHGSPVPGWLEAMGGVLIVAGFAATVPVFAANSFAAPVVQVQEERGHRVIDSGPYALVRHPMYVAAMLYLIGLPLLLGSWYGLIGAAAIMLAISWRATREEQTLERDLPGYRGYMARVRWRLVPYVW